MNKSDLFELKFLIQTFYFRKEENIVTGSKTDFQIRVNDASNRLDSRIYTFWVDACVQSFDTLSKP